MTSGSSRRCSAGSTACPDRAVTPSERSESRGQRVEGWWRLAGPSARSARSGHYLYEVVHYMGSKYRVLMSDAGGNNERLVFIFDSRKLNLLDEACPERSRMGRRGQHRAVARQVGDARGRERTVHRVRSAAVSRVVQLDRHAAERAAGERAPSPRPRRAAGSPRRPPPRRGASGTVRPMSREEIPPLAARGRDYACRRLGATAATSCTMR